MLIIFIRFTSNLFNLEAYDYLNESQLEAVTWRYMRQLFPAYCTAKLLDCLIILFQVNKTTGEAKQLSRNAAV